MKSKSLNSLISTLAFFALAFGTEAVQASMITVVPLNTVVTSPSTFDVTVVGRDFTDGAVGTLGGGFIVDWDPTILTLDSFNLTFAGDQGFAQAAVLDNVSGFLNADVSSFLTGVTTKDFDIAVLTFSTVGLGTSPLDLSVGTYTGSGSDIVWGDGDGFAIPQPTYADGSVMVSAVPVPAAVWLFGSGLLGLIGVARRHNAT
jgi:hypothetical protein